jgi:predicted metalloendopeptidase
MGMSPQTVNAYNASYNEIVFPAAILQPPFYNQADEAVNYGGIEELSGMRFLMDLTIQDHDTMPKGI